MCAGGAQRTSAIYLTFSLFYFFSPFCEGTGSFSSPAKYLLLTPLKSEIPPELERNSISNSWHSRITNAIKPNMFAYYQTSESNQKRAGILDKFWFKHHYLFFVYCLVLHRIIVKTKRNVFNVSCWAGIWGCVGLLGFYDCAAPRFWSGNVPKTPRTRRFFWKKFQIATCKTIRICIVDSVPLIVFPFSSRTIS